MEQDFQTSFIPKKPMIDSRSTVPRSVNIFTILAVFIFFTVLLATGGLYFYKGVIKKNIAQMEADLNLARNRFEPTKITQLQVLDKRLKAASEVLSKHIAISPIFTALQEVTMKTVRYNRFSYRLGTEKEPNIAIQMSGVAVGYRSIALQADLFTKNKNLIDPIFSNLSLDDTGNVLFDLSFSVNPSFVDYKQMLKIASSGSLNVGESSAVISN